MLRSATSAGGIFGGTAILRCSRESAMSKFNVVIEVIRKATDAVAGKSPV
jgi:hypothetical protein